MAAHQATEQIIEIRVGVGDPPSMRAVAGTQLGPISIGHRAAWKVVAVGVRDEHAFLYFDGETVFVQSVDPQNPAFVNGQPVSKEWMPVPVGSEIAFGEARVAVGLEATGGVSKSNRPFAPGEFVNEDSVVPVRTRNPTPAGALQTGPPDDRPFAPGELTSSDPELTKLAPIEEISRAARPAPQPGPPRGGTVQMVALPPGMAPNPAIPPAAPSSNPYGGMGGMGDPNMGMLPAYTPMGGVPMAAPHGFPQPGPSGPGGAAQGQAPSTSLLEKAKATWRAAPPPRKAIFVLTPLVLVSVFVLFSGESPPPPAPPRSPANTQQAATTAAPPSTPAPTVGPIETTTAAPTASTASVPPLGATTTPTTTPTASTAPRPPAIPPRGAGSAQKKSLERAAADAVAAGAFLEAASLYEQLARENPGNPSFAEAARILRSKGKVIAP